MLRTFPHQGRLTNCVRVCNVRDTSPVVRAPLGYDDMSCPSALLADRPTQLLLADTCTIADLPAAFSAWSAQQAKQERAATAGPGWLCPKRHPMGAPHCPCPDLCMLVQRDGSTTWFMHMPGRWSWLDVILHCCSSDDEVSKVSMIEGRSEGRLARRRKRLEKVRAKEALARLQKQARKQLVKVPPPSLLLIPSCLATLASCHFGVLPFLASCTCGAPKHWTLMPTIIQCCLAYVGLPNVGS